MNAFSSLIASGGGLGLLLLMVALPAFLGLACLALSRRSYGGQALLFFLGATVNLILALFILFGEEQTVLLPWAGFEINLALRIYGFSRLMLILSAVLFFLSALYSVAFMRRESRSGQVFFY